MSFEKNPDDLGALWVKSSARGDFMTGTISGVKVVVFKNEKKTSDKQPDWRVLRSKPKDGGMASPPAGTFNANDEDVPF
jgi:hypothetical protein